MKVRIKPALSLQILLVTLFFVSLWMRLFNLNHFQDNIFTHDEAWLSIVNLSAWLQGNPIYRSGSNQLTILWLLNYWFQIFSPMAIYARALSVCVGLVSCGAWFFYLRYFFKFWPALFGTLILLANVQLVYFSKLSIEPIYSFAFLTLIIPCIHLGWVQKSYRWSAAAGFFFALGIFTYPAFYIQLLSLFIAFLLFQARHLSEEIKKSWKASLLPFAISAIPLLSVGLYLHYFHFGRSISPFRSGGALIQSASDWKDSLSALLKDVFWSSDSWYLVHNIPFIDWGLWAFIAIGFFVTWKKRNKAVFVYLLSAGFLFFFVSLTTVYPGARRLISIFLPLSFVATHYFALFWNDLQNRQSQIQALAQSFVLFFLVLGCFAFSIRYYAIQGRIKEQNNFGYVSIPVTAEILGRALRFGTTYVDISDAPNDGFVETHYLSSLKNVTEKYYFNNRTISHLVLNHNAQAEQITLPNKGRWVFISKSKEWLLQLKISDACFVEIIDYKVRPMPLFILRAQCD